MFVWFFCFIFVLSIFKTNIMKKQTKSSFIRAVEHEINMIKQFATESEIKRLNFDSFNPIEPKLCIYGLMTGSCESKRAKDLMLKSCILTFNKGYEEGRVAEISISEIIDKLDSESNTKTWEIGNSDRNYQFLSALETYIIFPENVHQVKKIFKYLQGKTDKLNLKLKVK